MATALIDTDAAVFGGLISRICNDGNWEWSDLEELLEAFGTLHRVFLNTGSLPSLELSSTTRASESIDKSTAYTDLKSFKPLENS